MESVCRERQKGHGRCGRDLCFQEPCSVVDVGGMVKGYLISQIPGGSLVRAL